MSAERTEVNPTLGDLLDDAVRLFATAGVSEPRRSAEWLAEHAFGLSSTQRVLGRTLRPDQDRRAQFHALVQRRVRHEPVQYIVGTGAFMGLDLVVTPAVLIPRPETETVAEHALEVIRNVRTPRVLDIGTGSGCLAIAIARNRSDADVEAWDVSEGALDVAEGNAVQNGVRVRFRHHDVFADASAIVGAPYDLIVSNPPYIATEEQDGLQPDVLEFEPHLALFAGADPLRFYRRIAALAARVLVPGGTVVLETHADHGAETASCLEAAGLMEVAIHTDLAGRDRIAVGRRSTA